MTATETVTFDIRSLCLIIQGNFVHTGLLGFIGEGGLVFICGTIMDGLIQIAGWSPKELFSRKNVLYSNYMDILMFDISHA